MTTERQTIANRQNAIQSTGPKTPEGKASSRLNALRHGLRAETVVLPDECEDEYQAFHDGLWSELSPVGLLENILVDRVVVLAWRLRRMGRLESSLLTYGHFNEVARRAREGPTQYALDDVLGSLGVGADPGATAEAKRSTELQNAPTTATAVGVIRDEFDGMNKLHRYETALERSFFKALRELQTLQQSRPDREPDDVVD